MTTAAKLVLILNEAPYGGERTYNALRLGLAAQKQGAAVRVFLIGDAVTAALAGQETPNGFYNIGRMVKGILAGGGEVMT